MTADILMPIIYLVCLLILIGPRFLETNTSFKQLLSNLSIWALIIILISLGYQFYNYFIS